MSSGPNVGATEARQRWLGPLLVAAIAFVPRLASSLVNPLNYDGYWHVFIARNLPRELASLAHPPLFPILLRQADAIRHSRLSYLSISLVAGTAAVFLFGLVLQKLCMNRAMPLFGALALGFSPSAILLSGVAESYMLCVAFLLAALLPYMELLAPKPRDPAAARVSFAAFGTLALLTHYAAGLFLVASLAVPLVLVAFEPHYRQALKREFPARLSVDALTYLVPATVAALLFRFLARPWVRSLNHVARFYFDPTRESPAAFLARTLADTFNLFSPLQIPNPVFAAVGLVVFVASVVAIVVAADRRGYPSPPGATPAVFLVLLLFLEITAGLRGLYPFGGAMRHQIFLMLFALMSAVVAFDRILVGLPHTARRTLIAVGVAAIAANAWGHLEKRWQPQPEPFSAERQRFDQDFPEALEVHVDSFNLIGFFAQHHDWNWDFLGRDAGHPARERYRLSRNGRSLELVAHRDIWNMDPLRPEVYEALASAPASVPPHAITLYCVHQVLPGKTPLASESLRRQIPELARQAGLEVAKLDVVGANVFAEFRRVGPTGPKP